MIISSLDQLYCFESLVPPQTPERVDPLVITYIESEFAKLNSKNKLTIESLHGGKPWVTDVNHWNFEAAKAATRVIYLFSHWAQENDLILSPGNL
jgi:hypothetical protein